MDLFKLFQKSKNNSFIYFHCSKTKKNLFGTSKKFFFYFSMLQLRKFSRKNLRKQDSWFGGLMQDFATNRYL